MNRTISMLVRAAFFDRCAYCLGSQEHIYGKLEIEHIYPSSRGGSDEESNLCLACRFCNSHKSDLTEALDPLTNALAPLFNPRQQEWQNHFTWDRDGATILGTTPVGRATVSALQMNSAVALIVRRGWVQVGWYPPQD